MGRIYKGGRGMILRNSTSYESYLAKLCNGVTGCYSITKVTGVAGYG